MTQQQNTLIHFSVVIPLYNKDRCIIQTLKSVLNQSYKPIEIIVVDDGSTDSSAERVISVQSSLVRLVKKVNGGVSSARNLGVKEANSKYVAFLDADDIWHDNHLEVLAHAITLNPDAAMFSTVYEVLRDGVVSTAKFLKWNGCVQVLDDFFKSYARSLSLITSSTACVLKSALLSVGGFPENVSRGEDVITWIKVAHNYKVCHSDVVTTIYNQDAENRSEMSVLNDIPGSLRFISAFLSNGFIDPKRRKSLLALLDAICFFTAAGQRLKKNNSAILNLFAFSVDQKRIALSVKLLFLLLCPQAVLVWAKTLRRS